MSIYRPTLRKVLSSIDMFATGFGVVIGFGWILLFGSHVYEAGIPAGVLGWLIALVLMLFVGLTYGELTSSMPVAGGEAAYALRAFNDARVAYWTGWFMVTAYITLAMLYGATVPFIFAYFFPEIFKRVYLWSIAGFDVYLPMVIVGFLLAGIGIILNYYGAKPYGWAQTAMTLIFAVLGFGLFITTLAAAPFNPTIWTNMQSNMVGKLTFTEGLVMILGVAPFFYVGFDMIPQASEEYRAEPRKLGRLVLLSITIGGIWYILAHIFAGLVVNRNLYPQYELPIADGLVATWGPATLWILYIIGLFGALTTWSGAFYSATRVLFAAGRARVMPEFFARINKYGAPHYSIFFVGGLVALASLFGRRATIWFIDACSVFTALLYLMVALSFIKLRRNEPNMKRPWKAWGGVFSGAIAAIACILMFIFIIVPGMPSALIWPTEYIVFIAFVVLGIIYYYLTPAIREKIPLNQLEYLLLGEYSRQEQQKS
ncbi:MAG: APC family permease [Ignisphaera sp.]